MVGLLAWLPYFFYRAHTIGHPNDLAPHLVLQNWKESVTIGPMTWVALIARRLFNTNFAAWTAADGLHATWAGKWMGVGSFIDGDTLGLGWICLLVFVLFWLKGRRYRWIAYSFLGVSFLYSVVVCITITGGAIAQASPTSNSYTHALGDSNQLVGGRYLYPFLMAWFVAAAVLLNRQKTVVAENSKSTPPTAGTRP